MGYSISITTGLGFDDAVQATRQALGDEGFGVLTEIDLAATLKAKIGADLDPYLILGACRPPLAHAAVQADPSVGTLLPCSVVIRVEQGRTVVEAMDPALLTEVTGQAALAEVAADAKGRLTRALAVVAG
jgi:uncharacterized protein (DUF302 family)